LTTGDAVSSSRFQIRTRDPSAVRALVIVFYKSRKKVKKVRKAERAATRLKDQTNDGGLVVGIRPVKSLGRFDERGKSALHVSRRTDSALRHEKQKRVGLEGKRNGTYLSYQNRIGLSLFNLRRKLREGAVDTRDFNGSRRQISGKAVSLWKG